MHRLTSISNVPSTNAWRTAALPIDIHGQKDVSSDGPTACSSRVHFSDSSYTLGFGQLFSGELRSDVPTDERVEKAMNVMRMARNNFCQHSASILPMPPTLPHQNTVDGDTWRQAGIMKAAEMLERAACVISGAANASNNRCQ